MIYRMVSYRVKPEALAEVEQAIQEFIRAFKEAEPHAFYLAYRTPEETEFVHFMAFPDADAEAFHQKAPHTQRFVGVLYPNAERMPQFTNLSLLAASHQEEFK